MKQYLLEPYLVGGQRFREELQTQLRFLKKSAAEFDNGDEEEAKRMAVTLRNLFESTKKMTSVIRHLELEDKLNFADTAIYRQDLRAFQLRAAPDGLYPIAETAAEVGLLEMNLCSDGSAKWVAPLRYPRLPRQHPMAAATHHLSTFDFWWNTPLIESSAGHIFPGNL